MPATTPYDPATLAFVIDQAHYGSGGKKHYNPVPRLRTRSSPRPRIKATQSAPASPKPSAVPKAAVLTDPVYLLSVPAGQEVTIATQLSRYSTASTVLVPRNHNNEPLMPGYVLVSVAPDQYHAVVRLIQKQYWGWLSQDPMAPDMVEPFLPYAGDVLSDIGLTWGREHPVRQIAEAVLQSRGIRGTLVGDGWALTDRTGAPIVRPDFDDWWSSLVADWRDHRPLGEILDRHHCELAGMTFPLSVTGHDGSDLLGEWFGQPARVPSQARQGIRLGRRGKIWGVLTGRAEDEAQFSLTHPHLVEQRLGFRIGYERAVRDPGRWAAILVPRVTPTVSEHVRLAAQSLGWSETWRVVDRSDPVTVVRTLLKPTQVQVDRAARAIHLSGIDSGRMAWWATAQEWLSDWVIAR